MEEIKAVENQIDIRIEADGTITIVTGKMGMEVHKTAADFLEEITSLVGGVRTTEKLKHAHGHLHHHDHVHLKE